MLEASPTSPRTEATGMRDCLQDGLAVTLRRPHVGGWAAGFRV